MTIGDTKVPVGSVRCLSVGQIGNRAKLALTGATRMPICGPTFVPSDAPTQNVASQLPSDAGMLKLLGSIALARLLGFGILGFLVIYVLLTLLT